MKEIYTERINRVIEYVNNHLNESISLNQLAEVACFSSFHFHRIFTAVTGESVNFFTNRLRLEKAARLLKFSKDSITGIALSSGFSSSATFSRSFKQYFGITPNGYRKGEQIKNSKICKELFPYDEYIENMSDDDLYEKFPVEIRRFPERYVAYIRITDSYREGVVLEAFKQMISWAKQNGLFEEGTLFGMSIDDPTVTPKEKYRYEVCLTIPESYEINDSAGISIMTIPACSYALTRVSGDIKTVATATSYLFNKWLINSVYEPEHEHAMEIFLDKEKATDWSNFELELCIPVRPLQLNFNNN